MHPSTAAIRQLKTIVRRWDTIYFMPVRQGWRLYSLQPHKGKLRQRDISRLVAQVLPYVTRNETALRFAPGVDSVQVAHDISRALFGEPRGVDREHSAYLNSAHL